MKDLKQTVVEAVSPGMCTGCSACVNSCPKKALSFKRDRFGYFVPDIDIEKCNQCGLCVNLCPAVKLPARLNSDNPALYAFIARDESLLRKSSSGAAFGVLARHMLSQGGAVSGCAWNEDWNKAVSNSDNDSTQNDASISSAGAPPSSKILPVAEHIVVDNEADLERLHKSKYFQSYMGSVFSEIAELLKLGRRVLFCGCPCQVAGLRSYLRKDYDGLICVDLLCGNAPSQAFFAKYLKDSFRETPASYEFRNKTSGSWATHTVKVGFKNDNYAVIEKNADLFQKAYHKHIMTPPHCECCKYQSLPRYGDITIGDFWGISKHDPHFNTQKGVSLVLVNNTKGKSFFETIPENLIDYLEKKPLAWLGKNGCALKGCHNWSYPGRNRFYLSYSSGKSFEKSLEEALKLPNDEDILRLVSGSVFYFDSIKGSNFRFSPDDWEEHHIYKDVYLFAKRKESPIRRYAWLSFGSKLTKDTKYRIFIKFKVSTLSNTVNFYLMNGITKNNQLIYSYHVEDFSAEKYVIKEFVCEANSDYDSFMIAASQIKGHDPWIAFSKVLIIKDEVIY